MMSDKILTTIYNVLFLLAICVSIYYFGASYSLFVSLLFILCLYAQKSLQRILSSGISVLAPFILSSAKASVLSKYKYEEPIRFVNAILNKYSVNYSISKDEVDTVLVYILLFVIASLLFREDKTAIGKISPGGNPEFKEKTFLEKLDGYCITYSQRIVGLTRNENWNNALYVPIETEVELTKGHKIKRYEDLLKCIKKNKNRVPAFVKYAVKKVRNSPLCKLRIFYSLIRALEKGIGDNTVYLVLGDPGSGKSFSLRKLCLELLDEANITGKIPVYISLQTWLPDSGEWSDKNLPQKMDLINYIKKELYKDGDMFIHGFLDDYFKPMLEDGRFYFIFDSFDEMPCLMGGDNNSVLIKHISELIHDFLTGPNQNGGIIASRLYNRPSEYLDQSFTLRLLKFDNDRIRKVLRRSLGKGKKAIIVEMFKNRMDLVELCRNPFHLALLIDYIKTNKKGLPQNQFELFKDFVERRLESRSNQDMEEGIAGNEAHEAAIDLAVMMQKDKNFGLDYPIKRISSSCSRFGKDHWEKCIQLLTYAKICRAGGNSKTVSFVHRRFQEFFFVEALINGKEKITSKDLDGILENTGIRDALVLYCQIGEEEKIKNIADYCCSAIKDNEQCISGVLNEGSVKLVNAVYFLIEAFSNSKDRLSNSISIILDLKKYLKKETHYVVLMAIVNCISLLDNNDIQSTLLDIFRLQNRWLNSLIFSKCQLIRKLNRRTEIGFILYFEYKSFISLISKYFSDDFSLSLSKCFSYIRSVHLLLPFVFLSKTFLYLYAVICMLPLFQLTSKFIIYCIDALLGGFSEQYVNKIWVVDFELLVNEIREVTKSQPMSEPRAIMNTIGVFLIVAASIVMLSNFSMLVSNYFKDYEKTILKNQRFLKRNMIVKFFTTLRNGFKQEKEDSNRIDISSVVMLLFSMEPMWLILVLGVLKKRSPDGLLLFFLIVLEIFLAAYYMYRALHEVIIPLRTNKDIARLFFECIKAFPYFFIQELLIAFSLTVCIGIIGLLLFYILPIVICKLIGVEYSGGKVLIITVLFIMIFPISLVMSAFILCCRDCLFLLRCDGIERIEREELLSNINKRFFSRYAKRRYVKALMEKNVELYGEWPDNYTTTISDDVVVRNLAIWDCKNMGIENTYVDIMG